MINKDRIKAIKKRKGIAKHPRIANLIDKQIVLGSGKTFSFAQIKRQLIKMTELIEKRETTDLFSEFFSEFFELYELVYAPAKRAAAKIHPSSIRNACDKAVFFELTRVKESNPEAGKIGATLQKIFDTGDFWHTYIQTHLRRSGVLLSAEEKVISKEWMINGRTDGRMHFPDFPDDVLLEIKSMNSFAFQKLAEPLEDHKFQSSLYADILGIKYIIIIYVEKNFGNFKEYFIKVDRFLVKEAKEKITIALESKNSKTEPEGVCDTVDDESAEKCVFRNHCFK